MSSFPYGREWRNLERWHLFTPSHAFETLHDGPTYTELVSIRTNIPVIFTRTQGHSRHAASVKLKVVFAVLSFSDEDGILYNNNYNNINNNINNNNNNNNNNIKKKKNTKKNTKHF